MNPVSLMANASKLSVGQLQQAIKNGTVPAYIGIPMMQEKMKQAKQAQVAQAPTEPPIAQQVMAEASGIDQMPSNLPAQAMNDGGIVSFADGGDVEDFDQEEYEDQLAEQEYAQAIEDRLNAAEQGGAPKSADVNRTPSVEGGIKAPAGDFYKNMYGVLKAKAEEMGFKNPEAIARVGAAQSSLETGYGKALAGGNNYFGIKGSGGNKQSTKEYSPERGYYTSNESFRTYKGMVDSAADYPRLMQNPRYAKVAAAQTPEEAIDYQGRSGYATSPKYGSSLRAIHSANMAEGGIARLNKGGVARFQSQGLVTSQSNSVPPFPTANPNSPEYEKQVEEWLQVARAQLARDEAQLARDEEERIDNVIRELPKPENIYKETPRMDFGRLYGGFSSDSRNSAPKMPNVPLAERSKYIQHGSTFGSENAGADTYYPPSEAGSDAARFREQASGIIDLASAPSSSATTVPKGPTLVADDLYGGAAPSKDFSFVEPKTGAGVDTTKDTSSSGDSGGSSSGSSGGARQKSEYDLIREDIMNQREELKRQKQEDKYMAILQAGLGMMGGTSPNAMANIGQGASMGIAQYGASAKQRAAENAALNKGLITAQRYRSMDEYQRAALADREAGRTADREARSSDKADTLSQQDKALMIRTEDNTIAGISRREKQIEDNIKGLFKMDAFGQFEPGQMEKYNQAVAKAKAEDNDLKKYHTRMGALQKSLYNLDYTPPNYGVATPKTNLPPLNSNTAKQFQK